ncbi:21ce6f2c-6df0-4d51-82fe-49baba016066 [Thermothielavioides terrestris]|uniref:Restriction of telomere capping protein 5 n=1 Tax=Thermothielavioides terrestris TaxID=2587410 RepID=A0A3S4B9Y8_9PEZI|nr:21ce6f2c-6df0-4d51-82fe-49baba016066 [Thermothielavioides terrestris]
MGQAQSGETPARYSHEELSKQLADKFARKCFTPLELYSFRDVFNSLADHEHGIRYLKEDTIARFLEIPDALGVSAVLFQMVSCLGAFPFLEDAPAVLGLEQMIVVVTLLTERYRRVLAGGAADRRKLLFRSLAVYDRKLSDTRPTDVGSASGESGRKGADQDDGAALATSSPRGFAIDEPGDDDGDVGPDDDDDELVLAAFDSLGYVGAFRHGGLSTYHGAMIPADNWRKLIMLLLLAAPLGAQESLSSYSNRLSGEELDSLRSTAESVLASFLNVEQVPGIKFARFDRVIAASMPFMFNGLTPLFEHFLFSRNLDFHRHKDEEPRPTARPPELVQPLLEKTGSIMNASVLSQMSFFIPGSSLFRKLRLLYSGEEDGYSMGSFESKVFNWRAPTILLVSGTRLPDEAGYTHKGPASPFLASLPSLRFPPGNTSADRGETLTFGAYLSQPWKHTHRECFGAEDTILFQLRPIHDVFRASTVNKDYVSFTKPSASIQVGGISFGCPPPHPSQAYRRSNLISLGPVSLALEDGFEFGCFTHNYTSQGGAFQTSVSRRFDFQDRFEISSIED